VSGWASDLNPPDTRMRIALVFPWYTEKTTYIEGPLSRALAKLGHEVHLITSGLSYNHDSPNYERDLAPAFGPRLNELGVTKSHGVTVHRLPHVLLLRQPILLGLGRLLREIQPDVVQTGTVGSFIALACAFHRPIVGYQLFTGAHQAAEIAFTTRAFARRSALTRGLAIALRWIPGRLVSLMSARCYAVTGDTATVAADYYGVQRDKITNGPLGLDTTWFRVPGDSERRETRSRVRASLGFSADDIICVYSGRFNGHKNPRFLAEAIAVLRREGLPFCGLFIGAGEQADDLAAREGCRLHGYMPADQLAELYVASDIAAWPVSYSASQVEAAACGLPVIMTDQSKKLELREVCIPYRELDLDSMVAVLRRLASEQERQLVGLAGARIVHDRLSWNVIARTRARDYAAAVERRDYESLAPGASSGGGKAPASAAKPE
jgi:glycosyltransferase involved in cell wall biosynthesis